MPDQQHVERPFQAAAELRLGSLDDATAAYILAVHPLFEDLRQVSAQLAGLLVLAASGSKSATPDHPLLKSATELHRASLDALRSTRPTERARLHHQCMLRAARSLSQALAAAQESEIDPILTPLKTAHEHLQRAANQLPGFEMVDFKQGCCA
jgi:hypothetical protein